MSLMLLLEITPTYCKKQYTGTNWLENAQIMRKPFPKSQATPPFFTPRHFLLFLWRPCLLQIGLEFEDHTPREYKQTSPGMEWSQVTYLRSERRRMHQRWAVQWACVPGIQRLIKNPPRCSIVANPKVSRLSVHVFLSKLQREREREKGGRQVLASETFHSKVFLRSNLQKW